MLKRVIGRRQVVLIVISGVLGSGVYTKIAPMAAALNSPGWILLCWLIAGMLTFLGAIHNAELAALLADTGGGFLYFRKIYGRFFSFVYGWGLFAVIQTSAIASLAHLASQLIWSQVLLSPDHLLFPYRIPILAALLVIALGIVNVSGMKTGAKLTVLILSAVLSGIILLIIAGFTRGEISVQHILSFRTPMGGTPTVVAVVSGILSAGWAYQGWTAIGNIGGEIQDARKRLPFGILVGLAVVILIYLLVNTSMLMLLPMSTLNSIAGSETGVAAVEAMKSTFNTGVAGGMVLLILLTVLGCLHVAIYTSARTYFAMAKDGLFFPSLKKLNRKAVPANAIWLQGIWACLLVFTGSFDQLTDRVVIAVIFFSGATTLGVVLLRYKMRDAYRSFKVPAFPYLTGVALLINLCMLTNAILAKPREALIAGGLVAAAFPFYYWFCRSKVNGASGE